MAERRHLAENFLLGRIVYKLVNISRLAWSSRPLF